jgi:hypothetical protein
MRRLPNWKLVFLFFTKQIFWRQRGAAIRPVQPEDPALLPPEPVCSLQHHAGGPKFTSICFQFLTLLNNPRQETIRDPLGSLKSARKPFPPLLNNPRQETIRDPLGSLKSARKPFLPPGLWLARTFLSIFHLFCMSLVYLSIPRLFLLFHVCPLFSPSHFRRRLKPPPLPHMYSMVTSLRLFFISCWTYFSNRKNSFK